MMTNEEQSASDKALHKASSTKQPQSQLQLDHLAQLSQPPPPMTLPQKAQAKAEPQTVKTAGALPVDLQTFSPTRDSPLDHSSRYTYLAAYDIRDPRRLYYIHKCLLDYGFGVQYSVFECKLTGTEVEKMWNDIADIIDQRVDWVILYRLSSPYNQAIRNIGVYNPEHIDSDAIIFI